MGPEAFGGFPVMLVACGGFHTMAVTGGGHVWTCGENCAGQLGQRGQGVHVLDGAGGSGGAGVGGVHVGWGGSLRARPPRPPGMIGSLPSPPGMIGRQTWKLALDYTGTI
jgi:hypothetical protein